MFVILNPSAPLRINSVKNLGRPGASEPHTYGPPPRQILRRSTPQNDSFEESHSYHQTTCDRALVVSDRCFDIGNRVYPTSKSLLEVGIEKEI